MNACYIKSINCSVFENIYKTFWKINVLGILTYNNHYHPHSTKLCLPELLKLSLKDFLEGLYGEATSEKSILYILLLANEECPSLQGMGILTAPRLWDNSALMVLELLRLYSSIYLILFFIIIMIIFKYLQCQEENSDSSSPHIMFYTKS